MSNPAVTKLIRDRFDNMSFWMDDNIGESVHIHLGNFRLDLSVTEAYQLKDEITETITKLIAIPDFDCQKIDPVFLSRMLYPLLPHLTKAKLDEVNVGDLIVAYDTSKGFTKYVSVREGRAIKALNGDPTENEDKRGSHHIGQTSSSRLNDMLNSVKSNGYPLHNQYIIVYGDQMLVRDGQHRASCIYHLYGNVTIPILRLYFDNNELIEYETSKVKQSFRIIRNKNLSAKNIIHKCYSCIMSIAFKLKKTCYEYRNRKDVAYLEMIYPAHK